MSKTRTVAYYIELALSALTSGIIAGAGVAIGAHTAGADITKGTLTLALLLGLVAAAKDIRAQLKLPPVKQ